MPVFVEAFSNACPGHTVNYTSNGSGAGVSEFLGNRTDFGGSDSPLSQERGEYDAAQKRCGSPAWNLPVVFGPIAITYNLAEAPSLALDGPTAAKIFNGAITRWDDPAIKGLNPTLQLPPEDIQVVYRSDESGTTDNFQRYLDSASAGLWGKGTGKTFNGGVGQGAKGNEGTSAAVQRHARGDHLQRVLVRQTAAAGQRTDRDLCRADARADHRRHGRQDHFCCHSHRSRQRPGAGHLEVLRTDQPGGLPDRLGDL